VTHILKIKINVNKRRECCGQTIYSDGINHIICGDILANGKIAFCDDCYNKLVVVV